MVILLLSLFLFLFPNPVYAKYDPRDVPNNKYGIHIADTNDIPDTAPLVNSSGGDWGYVTMVIQENDRNFGKWQGIFNLMRRLHLIPIIRLATHPQADFWTKPTKESASDWAQFLAKLNWPTENRYTVIFNEPNHAKEWNNTINPEEYAELLIAFASAFKKESDDFFILPAGLDASAISDTSSLDEAIFLERMLAAQPHLLESLDGWTSHAYPNPGFSGSPYASGRGTLRTYDWELSLLQKLGNTKKLPVFITETGWMHSQGKVLALKLLSPEAVGANIVAAASVWQNERIVAVTPFVFNYQDYPFDHFSWRQLGTSAYYAPFFSYQTLPKISGKPKQHLIFTFQKPLFPISLVASSTYNLETRIKNEGSGILQSNDYTLAITGLEDFELLTDRLPTLEPGEEGTISVHVKTPQDSGDHTLGVSLVHYGEAIPLEQHALTVVPPPSLGLTVQLGWRQTSSDNDVTVMVYDNATLLHKFTGLTLEHGRVSVFGLTDIVPGNSYRIVVLVSGYLPRQTIQKLSGQKTLLTFARFLPLDIDRDGALTLNDLLTALHKKPTEVLPLFVGP